MSIYYFLDQLGHEVTNDRVQKCLLAVQKAYPADLTKIEKALIEKMREELFSITSIPDEIINLLNLEIEDLVSLCKTSKKLRESILKSSLIKVSHTVVYYPLYRNYLKLLPNIETKVKYVEEVIKGGSVQELKIKDKIAPAMFPFDLSILSSLHSLDLGTIDGNENPTQFSDTTMYIRDLSAFRHIHTLNLSRIGSANFPILGEGSVYSLDLSWNYIENASAFKNIHTLNLARNKITDASMLGNVYNLNLSMNQIEDASALGRVHTLDLSYTYVTDVSALKMVHTLNLAGTGVVFCSSRFDYSFIFLFWISNF
jgi:hypothetical protein